MLRGGSWVIKTLWGFNSITTHRDNDYTDFQLGISTSFKNELLCTFFNLLVNIKTARFVKVQSVLVYIFFIMFD